MRIAMSWWQAHRWRRSYITTSGQGGTQQAYRHPLAGALCLHKGPRLEHRTFPSSYRNLAVSVILLPPKLASSLRSYRHGRWSPADIEDEVWAGGHRRCTLLQWPLVKKNGSFGKLRSRFINGAHIVCLPKCKSCLCMNNSWVFHVNFDGSSKKELKFQVRIKQIMLFRLVIV
jgi:hypothetical protein